MSVGAPLGHTVHVVPAAADDAHPECVEAQISAHCDDTIGELRGCKHVRLLSDGYPLMHHVPHDLRDDGPIPRTWHRLDEHP